MSSVKRTPLQRDPSDVISSPVTVWPASTRTFGSDSTRRRIANSSRLRLGASANMPEAARARGRPSTHHSMSSCTSKTGAPRSISSWLSPSNSSSSAARPRARSPCTCPPCGTPFRTSGAPGSASRSSTTTSSNVSCRARAARSPATDPPMTTARPLRVCLIRPRVGTSSGAPLNEPAPRTEQPLDPGPEDSLHWRSRPAAHDESVTITPHPLTPGTHSLPLGDTHVIYHVAGSGRS